MLDIFQAAYKLLISDNPLMLGPEDEAFPRRGALSKCVHHP